MFQKRKKSRKKPIQENRNKNYLFSKWFDKVMTTKIKKPVTY